jgi:hypothetical protein
MTTPMQEHAALTHTDQQAIDSVKNGGRATTSHSLHAAESVDAPMCNHVWRTVACNDEQDVVECRRCGRQRLAACNFDEDFA